MNVPYDREPGDRRADPRQPAPGGDPWNEDPYTRDTYASYEQQYYASYPEDDPYAGADNLPPYPGEGAPYGQQYPTSPAPHAYPTPTYPPQPYPAQQYSAPSYPAQQYGVQGADAAGHQSDPGYEAPYYQPPDVAPYAPGPYQAAQPGQPAGQQAYDPREGGYTTAQFMAGQFDQAEAPAAPWDQSPAAGYPAEATSAGHMSYGVAPAQAPPPGPSAATQGEQQTVLNTASPAGGPDGVPGNVPGDGAGSEADGAGEPPSGKEAASSAGGRRSGLMKSSAVMAAGTMVSRALGMVRNIVVATAIGMGVLGDSYQSANTLPTLLYILVGGGAVNAVFIPQLVRAMKEDPDDGEGYANRLLTLMLVVMGAVTVAAVLAAPLLVHLISNKLASNPDTYDVTVTFTRYLVPIIFFMGIHVVLGQILNARGRFGAMMWTPALNNIIIITTFGLFIWVYGPASQTGMTTLSIPPEGVRLLGLGTLLGLVVQSTAMVPYLRKTGFRIRLRFDWRGHGLGKAARLAKWTFLFVLANQAGLLVLTQLSTAAQVAAEKHGHNGTGLTAYNNALMIWQLPQAMITVSLMTAILPRIARSAADHDHTAVRDDLSYGLRTSAVAIVPCAFVMLAVGPNIGTLLFSGAGTEAARSSGYILMALGLGLIPFSAQYVMLRGFYAYEDTKTPFFNTVWIALATAVFAGIAYLTLPAQYATIGMSGGYALAYLVGVWVAARKLRKRLGDLDGARVIRTYVRLCGASVPAAVVAFILVRFVNGALGWTVLGSLSAVVGGIVVFAVLFVVIAKLMRIEEMTAMVAMVRSKLGR